MQNWIKKAAKVVKTIDKKHLLTIGEEDFYATQRDINPASWASNTGQYFIPDHMDTNIDYASSHLWTDNWNIFSRWGERLVGKRDDLEFSKKWIEIH